MSKPPVKLITVTKRSKKTARILLLGSERIGQSAIREVLESAGNVVLAAEDLGTAVIMLSAFFARASMSTTPDCRSPGTSRPERAASSLT
jgi:hypothetical protein